MNSKNFIDEFNMSVNHDLMIDKSDYERFKNKELLDLLRSKIIQNLIDDNINSQSDIESFIREEIDNTLEGYEEEICLSLYIPGFYSLIWNKSH